MYYIKLIWCTNSLLNMKISMKYPDCYNINSKNTSQRSFFRASQKPLKEILNV